MGESLEPFAVKIPEAGRLLGNKCRSEIYEEIKAGLLEAVKDGRRTLITVRSIRALQQSWPPAKLSLTA